MTGSSVRETKETLARFGLRAKKTLGQHFLVATSALDRVVRAADLSASDFVIEIGPGLGVLTRRLAQHAGSVIAVEADRQMAEALPHILSGFNNVAVVNQDILDTTPDGLLSAYQPAASLPRYKVVANIPYYITSPVLRHFLEAAWKPSLMVVMVQKEVGQAIVAPPGDLGILAISVQFYGQPSLVAKVPATAFYPPPKVDSVILRIDLYDQPPVSVPDTYRFFEVVKAGFSAPRKQLRNSLAQGLNISPGEAEELLKSVGIDPKRRAETLSLEEWARLCR